MAKKPKDAARTGRASSAPVFDELSFIDGVFNDEYILVVGNGVILNREFFPDSDGDINRQIVKDISEDRGVELRSFNDIYLDTKPTEEDPIYDLLANNYDYDLMEISPELKSLISTRLFRFVFTTTIDGYLEELMRSVWKGEEVRIVDIADNRSLKDFKDALENSRQNRYTQPTLFYIFGHVVKGQPKPRRFMETEVDAIKFIEKWINLDRDNKAIVPFLKQKRLLAVGCHFDEWYFRFFWYILTRGFTDADRDGAKHMDGSLMTNDNLAALDRDDFRNKGIANYFDRRGVCLHKDVWQFMTHIHSLLTSTDENAPFRRLILERRRQERCIFISYKSNDVATASELFCKLSREKGLNVWFDHISLHVGDHYREEIHEAIRHAAIFLPVLTPSVAAELENMGEDIDTFYSDEWRWAAQNDTVKVFPVAYDGYSEKAEVHQKFNRIIKHEVTLVNMTQRAISGTGELVGYDKLLDSINKHLGISD